MTSFDLSKRGSWRGFKICQSCGHVQGQRKLVCGNESCPLRQKVLSTHLPFDPIKLISKNSAYYSLRCKEREIQPRSFVEISEVTLALEPDSTIVSRNATCHVDTCKYSSTGMACNHVKACNVDPNKPIPTAEIYSLSREVLWNLNIDIKHKQRLWEMYKEDETDIPPIQRLNTTTFAVKCAKSKVFPAGRLHVTAVSNGIANSKKITHACMCKKLKIILEADNSVVMQEEICDHLLLVLAAILSKPNGKHMYKNFANALKSFWMPAELEKPVLNEEDAFFGLDINIGGNFGETNGNANDADDIFIFDDKFLSNDNLPDFTDIVLDLNPNDFLQTQQQYLNSTPTSNVNALTLLHAGDPNLVSSCDINEEDIDLCFDDIISTTTATSTALSTPNIIDEVSVNSGTHLELSDCNIELMDQFQLTDRIDLCSDEIDLQNSATSFFDSASSISILTNPQDTLTQSTPTIAPITIALPQVTNSIPCFNENTVSNASSGNSLLKSSHKLLPATTTLEAPPIELPTIAMFKKPPVKAKQIVSEIKTRKFPHIPPKRALIVNTPLEQLSHEKTEEFTSAETEPALGYSAWLEYVIETINDSIEITDETNISHTFHVHEEIFSHFSKSFSIGIKRRMPNFTTIIKTGKHKGLIKYTWYFSTVATVRRIFSTKNIALQVERSYEKTNDGDFVPYIRATTPVDVCNGGNAKKRRIYPKLALYMAHIWFDCNNDEHKTGFKVEWLPNAFPKSHFGILKIDFSLGIKDPFKISSN